MSEPTECEWCGKTTSEWERDVCTGCRFSENVRRLVGDGE